MQKRYFTLEEANDFIPTLEYKLPRVLSTKKELSTLVTFLHQQGIAVPDLMTNSGLTDEKLKDYRTRLQALSFTLSEAVAEIETHGCLIKDMELGLVDFYGMIGREEVLFCWQLGETEIAYWHRTSEGFSSRRPLFDEEDASLAKVYH